MPSPFPKKDSVSPCLEQVQGSQVCYTHIRPGWFSRLPAFFSSVRFLGAEWGLLVVPPGLTVPPGRDLATQKCCAGQVMDIIHEAIEKGRLCRAGLYDAVIYEWCWLKLDLQFRPSDLLLDLSNIPCGKGYLFFFPSPFQINAWEQILLDAAAFLLESGFGSHLKSWSAWCCVVSNQCLFHSSTSVLATLEYSCGRAV